MLELSVFTVDRHSRAYRDSVKNFGFQPQFVDWTVDKDQFACLRLQMWIAFLSLLVGLFAVGVGIVTESWYLVPLGAIQAFLFGYLTQMVWKWLSLWNAEKQGASCCELRITIATICRFPPPENGVSRVAGQYIAAVKRVAQLELGTGNGAQEDSTTDNENDWHHCDL